MTMTDSMDGRYVRLRGFVAGESKAQQVYVRKTDIIQAAAEEVKRLLVELLLIEEDDS